ncbi:MAG: OmpH family outer membrane protein [Gammaproteobacteria bacterium]|nr:OmpH family outer membrane protein [Gammaproteobacteria bacterium]
MKLKKLWLVSAMTLMFSPLVAAELKIGVVNIARVMEEAPQAESARTSLQNEFAPRERELVELQKSVRSLEERLARNGTIMSEAERGKLEREILAKKRDFQRDQEAFRDDLNFKRNDLLEKLQREMVGIIQQYAKQQKFDVLLAEGVIYMSESVDVTEQVLSELKKKK